MMGRTHGSTAGFHLQTRDTDGRRVPLPREEEGQREREGGRKEGHISSDWSAGVDRERERDLK